MARDDLSVKLVDWSGSSPLLAPLGGVLGVDLHGAAAVKVVVNRVPISIALLADQEDDSIKRVRVTADFEVPPQTPAGPFISLRLERETDRREKKAGLVIEPQLGDPAFDGVVFIDSNASAGEVRRTLNSPETRAAVLALFGQGVDGLRLDSRTATATLPFPDAETVGPTLQRTIDGLLVIARTGGTRGEPVAPRGGWLLKVLGGALVVGGLSALAAIGLWKVHFSAYVIVALAFGGLSHQLARVLARPFVAGDSGSSVRLREAQTLSFFAGGFFGLAGLLAFNALSVPQDRHHLAGVILRVGSQDAETSTWDLDVQWSNGEVTREDLDCKSPRPGQHVERTWHDGRLLEWNVETRVRP